MHRRAAGIRDSKDMTLAEMGADWLLDQASRRPHRRSPADRRSRPLRRADRDDAAIAPPMWPGRWFPASRRRWRRWLRGRATLPEVTQTVILTRVAGRTPMPEGEDLEALADHPARCASILSITLLHEVTRALRAAPARAEDAAILVVQKASWPGEEIIRGTIADIKGKCQAEKVGSQAMIVAKPDARRGQLARSGALQAIRSGVHAPLPPRS